jgi:hypothetical protein
MAWFGRSSREGRAIRSRLRRARRFEQAQSHDEAEQAAMGWPYAQDVFMAAGGQLQAQPQPGEDRPWQQYPYGGPGEAGQQRPGQPERELADHGQAGQEASDAGKRQRGSDAEQAASGRLRDAMTHAEHARAAYESARAAERVASARAEARAARLAAKEAQFYADLEVTDARAALEWLRRAYSAPPTWLAAGPPGDHDRRAAEAEQAGRDGEPVTARGSWAADDQQRPEDSRMGHGEQQARQRWLAGGAARDDDEALWFEQFGDEDSSDRSASELDYIAAQYQAERETRAAARAQQERTEPSAWPGVPAGTARLTSEQSARQAQQLETLHHPDRDWSGYKEEREENQRYAAGAAPDDAAGHQPFAKSGEESADDGNARSPATGEQLEGWTQIALPGYAEQQRQLDRQRAADPWHDCTGPGYTEPEIDWDPEEHSGDLEAGS